MSWGSVLRAALVAVVVFPLYAWMNHAPSDTVRKRRGAAACAFFGLVAALTYGAALLFDRALVGSPLRGRWVVVFWATLVTAIVAGWVYSRLRRRDETPGA